MRQASRLVRRVRASKSVIWLRVGAKLADARSILAILLLVAVAGMVLKVKIAGEDETAILCSIAEVLTPGEMDAEVVPLSATPDASTRTNLTHEI